VDIPARVAKLHAMTRLTDSLDEGRVSFGDRDEIELASAVDPVCGTELKRADAAGAVDFHGTVYFFCSTACRDQFTADPELFISQGEEARG
jgi:YHS domain-containing protein